MNTALKIFTNNHITSFEDEVSEFFKKNVIVGWRVVGENDSTYEQIFVEYRTDAGACGDGFTE